MIKQTLSKSVLAGVCIGIASMMYLKTGGIAGAVLFSFGLLAIVNYKWYLFTGMSGFTTNIKQLAFVLLCNIIGCGLVSLLLTPEVNTIVTTRISVGWGRCLFLSVGCGFIMTTSVNFARKKNFLPLLFGVPTFILCGFPHCIADVVYYLSCPLDFLSDNILTILPIYGATILGNYIGCNLYRFDKTAVSQPSNQHDKTDVNQ